MKKTILFVFCLLSFWNIVMAQKNFQIRWQNRPRNFIVYLPVNFSPSENLPLVINMHGFLTNASFQMNYSQFNKTADTARCIAIYPEGVDLRWNSGTFFFVSSTVDDVGFLGDLMDRAAVLYNADMKKVYAMGYSAGGFMSYKLACDATNRIAAIAPDVASMVNDNISSCVPARPIHIAAFNGTADPITAYNGFPGNFPGIDSVKHFWQIKNGCHLFPSIDTLPDLQNDGTRVVRYSYEFCDQNVQQVYYKVINGGHVWPGADDIFGGILGKTTRDISMNTEAWSFFKEKEIPVNVQCDAPGNLQSYAVSSDSFLLSWDAVPGVNNYKIAIADDSDRVKFYETSNTSWSVKTDQHAAVSWNVASLCSTGFHHWNTTRPLNFTPTFIYQNNSVKFDVYPNPAEEYIQADFSGDRSLHGSLSIYDISGKKVTAINNILPGNRIPVSYLPKGWYQIKVETKEKTFISSFLRQ